MAAVLLASILSSCATKAPVEVFPDLVGVKKIYIASLGAEEGAGLVREKIRLGLMKSGRFSVVEFPEDADAILMGVAGVERTYSGSAGNLQTRHSGLGILRLVSPKTKSTIWTFEYKRGFGWSLNAASRVADQTVNRLLSDTLRAEGGK